MIINGRRGSCSYLIKHVPDVGLWFSKPHGEHLGSFDGHKVCLALVGDGLGQQGLPTARRAIEQHSTRRSHTKLKELVRIFDRVLRRARGALMDYWWHLCLQVHAESRECLSVSSTWTSSCSSLLTSSSPPMSSQLTWGTSAQVSLRADGLLWLSAHWGKAWWGQGKEALFFEGLIEYSLEKAKVCLCVFVCVCVCTWKSSMVTASELSRSASMDSSSRSMRIIFLRMACRAASEHRAARSAPTWPWVSAAIWEMLNTSGTLIWIY